ncbi:MAG TPA: hypothetical protein VK943_17325 [Arenibaculum sp.]|nr:hypothetical protein [Arenibaculum sp.]
MLVINRPKQKWNIVDHGQESRVDIGILRNGGLPKDLLHLRLLRSYPPKAVSGNRAGRNPGPIPPHAVNVVDESAR